MKIMNLFGKICVGLAGMAVFCDVQAADNGRTSRSTMVSMNSANTSSGRMPTMPIVSLNTIGNPAVETINEPVEVKNLPTIIPTPDPEPQPEPVCPDGGVKNSDYTVTMCMNDVLNCINTGALQGGLHDMFNEDVRNSIFGGMKLCQIQIDRCVSEVRVDCRNVYNETTDVWLDFNSRIVQPEYYNFVLRKTGLTPNQAENTCLLLDRNTYGPSFASVSDMNAVNSEYNNKVGAYNRANGGTLSKDNPQGVAVNTVGYDGNRGHYARWDAVNAECLIRVGAYNKDKQITNSWLFGAVGNNEVAEVWQKAGSTFTCGKELFDFNSLLNDTKTAAVIAVPGGAVLGTAIGAAAGAAAYDKKAEAMLNNPCDDMEYRRKLGAYITSKNLQQSLGGFLVENVVYDSEGAIISGDRVFANDTDFYNMTLEQCNSIHGMFAKLQLYEDAMDLCEKNKVAEMVAVTRQIPNVVNPNDMFEIKSSDGFYIRGVKACDFTTVTEYEVSNYVNKCTFRPLQKLLVFNSPDNPLCEADNACRSAAFTKSEMALLRNLLNQIEPVIDKSALGVGELDKGKEIGKGAAIGAVSGAAAGGLATAITAFVERSNISCKVGDGLGSVGLDKSYTIDSLKDFYVKWNLHLPDAVSPTSAVMDRASWEQACSQFNSKLADCPKVQINMKDAKGKYTLIPSACKVSGSICIINDAVAASHGIK